MLHTGRRAANPSTAVAPRLATPHGLRLCPSRPQRCTSHMSGAQIRGQAGDDSGLWLPPTRPSRKSVQTQAMTGEAKIKVISVVQCANTCFRAKFLQHAADLAPMAAGCWCWRWRFKRSQPHVGQPADRGGDVCDEHRCTGEIRSCQNLFKTACDIKFGAAASWLGAAEVSNCLCAQPVRHVMHACMCTAPPAAAADAAAACLTSACMHVLLQALAASPLPTSRRVQIGSKLTRGLGAGGNPGVGLVRSAALTQPASAALLAVLQQQCMLADACRLPLHARPSVHVCAGSMCAACCSMLPHTATSSC